MKEELDQFIPILFDCFIIALILLAICVVAKVAYYFWKA